MPQAWHFFFKTPGSSLNGVGLAQLLIGYCDMLPDLPGMIWDNHSPASDQKSLANCDDYPSCFQCRESTKKTFARV